MQLSKKISRKRLLFKLKKYEKVYLRLMSEVLKLDSDKLEPINSNTKFCQIIKKLPMLNYFFYNDLTNFFDISYTVHSNNFFNEIKKNNFLSFLNSTDDFNDVVKSVFYEIEMDKLTLDEVPKNIIEKC